MSVQLGDCLEVLPTLPENSVDACVTDPPYGLSFMGKGWDKGVPGVEFWQAIIRVIKPGAHLLAFGGTRTYHRMACAIEDAGFEIRDQMQWIYGSGFPKSHNLHGEHEGWGTALKPAHEPIVVARKPLDGTVAENVQRWGTGAINVDGCRVGEIVETWPSSRSYAPGQMQPGGVGITQATGAGPAGRWPANVMHDGSAEVLDLFPDRLGATSNSTGKTTWFAGMPTDTKPGRGDSGSAARFFYCPKASKRDRDEGLSNVVARFAPTMGNGIGGKEHDPGTATPKRNHHPTVKPTDLMRYLCRLVTPPNGLVLDPFAGSGSTGKAAVLEGFRFIGIEREPEYHEIAQRRVAHAAG